MPCTATLRDWLALLVLTVLWGSAFMLNELALTAFPPTVLVAGRIFIAMIVIYGYLALGGHKLPPMGRAWLPMGVLAVFGNVLPFHLVAWAQQTIDSSTAGILLAVVPLFVLLLAHFLLPGGRLTRWRLLGSVVGFSGVILIIGPNAVSAIQSPAFIWSAIATLGAALAYAISMVYARRLGPGDPVCRAAGVLMISSVLAVPAAVVDLPAIATPGGLAVVSLLVLGMIVTGFATILCFRLIQGPGPEFLSLVNYLVPAWAVLAGIVLLNESVSSTLLSGLVLILLGIAGSEFGARISLILHSAAHRLTPRRPHITAALGVSVLLIGGCAT